MHLHHRTCISSIINNRIGELARTLVVLDVDGQKERFRVKNTHTLAHTLACSTRSTKLEKTIITGDYSK